MTGLLFYLANTSPLIHNISVSLGLNNGSYPSKRTKPTFYQRRPCCSNDCNRAAPIWNARPGLLSSRHSRFRDQVSTFYVRQYSKYYVKSIARLLFPVMTGEFTIRTTLSAFTEYRAFFFLNTYSRTALYSLVRGVLISTNQCQK